MFEETWRRASTSRGVRRARSVEEAEVQCTAVLVV